MKKLLLISSLALLAACSNNAKTEEQETAERDSLAKIQEAQNQNEVDAKIAADEARYKFIADSTKQADSLKMLNVK